VPILNRYAFAPSREEVMNASINPILVKKKGSSILDLPKGVKVTDVSDIPTLDPSTTSCCYSKLANQSFAHPQITTSSVFTRGGGASSATNNNTVLISKTFSASGNQSQLHKRSN